MKPIMPFHFATECTCTTISICFKYTATIFTYIHVVLIYRNRWYGPSDIIKRGVRGVGLFVSQEMKLWSREVKPKP